MVLLWEWDCLLPWYVTGTVVVVVATGRQSIWNSNPSHLLITSIAITTDWYGQCQFGRPK